MTAIGVLPISNAPAGNALGEPDRNLVGAVWRFFVHSRLSIYIIENKRLLTRAGSLTQREGLLCTIRGKTAGQIGQYDLRFVRRGVSYCSAVAGGFLALPSPSLGVSSLDLGRSRKVGGPFS